MAKYFGLLGLVGLCGLSVFITVVSSRGLENNETTRLQKLSLVYGQPKERFVFAASLIAVAVAASILDSRAFEQRSIAPSPIVFCPFNGQWTPSCTKLHRKVAPFCFSNICSCGYNFCNRNSEECIKSSDGTYLCKPKN